jgi:hypothetical protein
MGINWTEDIVARLAEHFKEGLSISESATRLTEEFGIAVSRSAVVGKRHRWGLITGPQTSRQAQSTRSRMLAKRRPKSEFSVPRQAKKPTTFTATSNKTGLFVSGKVLPTAPMPVEDVPPVDLVKFADLSEQSCKWIYGDPKESSHGYCGKQVVPGLSWCSGHRTRVFSPPVVRQRPPQPVYVPTVADLEKV